ncbi:MAG: RNA 2',3'-cyclic phosphodiesterase [Chloroflexi bacterium]|nr:RNA 2',3'-cyclic phosphodiesterase [Chloroflexota bacterium]
MEYLRTFIAIELPEEVKTELEALQRKLGLHREPGVSCVKPASTHLTLKFLGNTPVDKLKDIQETMRSVTAAAGPFVLELKGVGCFPNTRQPRVVWVGLTGGEELLSIQSLLEGEIEKLGFPAEARAFAAHLTLARVRDNCSPEARRRLGETVAALDYHPGVKFTADHISLIKSVLKPSGPEYTTLYQANLV